MCADSITIRVIKYAPILITIKQLSHDIKPNLVEFGPMLIRWPPLPILRFNLRLNLVLAHKVCTGIVLIGTIIKEAREGYCTLYNAIKSIAFCVLHLNNQLGAI